MEKYIINPKHIEIQVLADEHGNLHLSESGFTGFKNFQDGLK
jgi:acetyl/propionyl-CoA carboxylase alpha subunit